MGSGEALDRSHLLSVIQLSGTACQDAVCCQTISFCCGSTIKGGKLGCVRIWTAAAQTHHSTPLLLAPPEDFAFATFCRVATRRCGQLVFSDLGCRTKAVFVRVRAQLPALCCKSFRTSSDQPVEAASRACRAVSRRDAGAALSAAKKSVRAPTVHSLQDPRPDTADTPWVRPFRPSWRRPAHWWHERQRRRPWCCVDWKVGVTHRQIMSERVLVHRDARILPLLGRLGFGRMGFCAARPRDTFIDSLLPEEAANGDCQALGWRERSVDPN